MDLVLRHEGVHYRLCLQYNGVDIEVDLFANGELLKDWGWRAQCDGMGIGDMDKAMKKANTYIIVSTFNGDSDDDGWDEN
jgi:hypothetical protein